MLDVASVPLDKPEDKKKHVLYEKLKPSYENEMILKKKISLLDDLMSSHQVLKTHFCTNDKEIRKIIEEMVKEERKIIKNVLYAISILPNVSLLYSTFRLGDEKDPVLGRHYYITFHWCELKYTLLFKIVYTNDKYKVMCKLTNEDEDISQYFDIKKSKYCAEAILRNLLLLQF